MSSLSQLLDFWILHLHASSYLVEIHFLQLVDRMWQPSDTKPLDPSLYDYSPYFSSKLPPAMVDRWIIPLQMFNSENFYLIGQGNFSTVYYSTIQGPLTTPTQLEYYKNYSEHGVAVKLLNGKRVYAPHHVHTCSDGVNNHLDSCMVCVVNSTCKCIIDSCMVN